MFKIKYFLFLPFLFIVSCDYLTKDIKIDVDNFGLGNVSPNALQPKNTTSFDVSYDLLAKSMLLPEGTSLPIDQFGLSLFVEDVQAVKSNLPSGTKSIKTGEPIPLVSKVVIGQVTELASKISDIALKDTWNYAVKGDVGVKGFNFPVNASKSMDSPFKAVKDQLPFSTDSIQNIWPF